MAVKVLIVDDSGFFRRRLAEMIGRCPGLVVVGTASNGREAIERVRELRPDVVTMDYEMPVMDGISAVRVIMREHPTPILMFSSLTHEGARVTLDSLEAGAVDYLPKNFDEIARSSAELQRTLGERLRAIVGAVRRPPARSAPTPQPARARSGERPRRRYRLLVIGTSTGGPVALQSVLTALPEGFPVPVVVVQHMPASFTPAFAERLDGLCRIRVGEARDGDLLRPGWALVAPGGRQLMIAKGGRVHVLDGDDRLSYKPCVDVTFGSAMRHFGADVLAVVLTGMGSDGCDGARLLKQGGATIWAQDEATSVIYGMPQAVARAGLTDEILPLEQIGPRLAELTAGAG